MNLSYPEGSSINDCIQDDIYDEVAFKLKYPTVDDIVQQVVDLDQDVVLSKIDISRAFCNLRLDPIDYDVMGLSWKNKSFIDVSIPMEAKTSSALCQRTTDVLRHIMTSKGVQLYNYIDDVICIHK